MEVVVEPLKLESISDWKIYRLVSRKLFIRAAMSPSTVRSALFRCLAKFSMTL